MSTLAAIARLVPGAGALRARRRARRFAGAQLLETFADTFPSATFIEIGANDGLQHDHLRGLILRGGWRGVMVEPVPYVFERLRENYASQPGVALDNVAIAEEDGRRPFYHLAQVADHVEAGLPPWYDGLGSFSREAVLSHARAIPDVGARLVEAEVPALTFDTLCARHGLEHVDLVLIDVEGYEPVLLEQIDFDRYRPTLVIYEHYHLSAAQRSVCADTMRRSGYEIVEEGFDSWCLRAGSAPALSDLWARLRPAVPGLYAEDER